jgi:hypothetical protein
MPYPLNLDSTNSGRKLQPMVNPLAERNDEAGPHDLDLAVEETPMVGNILGVWLTDLSGRFNGVCQMPIAGTYFLKERVKE